MQKVQTSAIIIYNYVAKSYLHVRGGSLTLVQLHTHLCIYSGYVTI